MFEDEVDGAASAVPVEDSEADERALQATPVANDGETADTSPVAGALAELDTLADRDLAEHPEVFERVHGALHDALTAIDDA